MDDVVPTFFFVFYIICASYGQLTTFGQRRDTPDGCGAIVHTFPADIELFATLAIPQVEEADSRLCRIRPELVFGIVL